MQILQQEKRQFYIEKYSIQHYFSFPIEPHLQIHTFQRGEWINHEGSFPEYLFYLVEGRAKIYKTEANGKVSLVSFAEEHMFIGEMELLYESYYSKGIQTTSDTVCLAIPLSTCKDLLLNDAVFLRQLSMFLGNKATNMTIRFSHAQTYPFEQRLAEFILLSAHKDVYKEKHTEVCDYLGVSYRHLLYVLAQFCEQGLLKKEGRSYLIENKPKLQQLATRF